MLTEHASPYEFRRILEYADGTNMQIRTSLKADFRAELALKSVRNGLILLETNTQIRMSSKKTNTQTTCILGYF